MKKKPVMFRMSDETLNKIQAIKEKHGENRTQITARAIDMLHHAVNHPDSPVAHNYVTKKSN